MKNRRKSRRVQRRAPRACSPRIITTRDPLACPCATCAHETVPLSQEPCLTCYHAPGMPAWCSNGTRSGDAKRQEREANARPHAEARSADSVQADVGREDGKA